MTEKYYQITPKVRIALPADLAEDVALERVERFKNNLNKPEKKPFNPKIRKFN